MIDSTRTLSLIPSTPMGSATGTPASAEAPPASPTQDSPLRMTMAGDSLTLQPQGIRIGGCFPPGERPATPPVPELPATPQAASQGFITRFLEACKAFFNTLFPRASSASTTPASQPPVPPQGSGTVPEPTPTPPPATGLLLVNEQARALLNQGISQSLALVQQLQTAFPVQPQVDQAMARVQEAMMEMTRIIQTGTYQGKPVAAYGEELVATVHQLRTQLATQAGPMVDTARQEIERALRSLEGVAAELSKSR